MISVDKNVFWHIVIFFMIMNSSLNSYYEYIWDFMIMNSYATFNDKWIRYMNSCIWKISWNHIWNQGVPRWQMLKIWTVIRPFASSSVRRKRTVDILASNKWSLHLQPLLFFKVWQHIGCREYFPLKPSCIALAKPSTQLPNFEYFRPLDINRLALSHDFGLPDLGCVFDFCWPRHTLIHAIVFNTCANAVLSPCSNSKHIFSQTLSYWALESFTNSKKLVGWNLNLTLDEYMGMHLSHYWH